MTASQPLPLFILGAQDHEMQAIEALLTDVGAPFAHAAKDGRRVTAGTAYEADSVIGAVPDDARIPVYGCTICGLAHMGEDCSSGPTSAHERNEQPPRATVLVECGGMVEPGLWVVGRCDHHRPGDPGAGKPPAEFLAGSSIGQVLAVLARHGALRDRIGVAPGEGPGVGPVGSLVSSRAPGSLTYSPATEEWRVVGPHVTETGGRPVGYLIPVSADIMMIAAMDHCPAAAVRGECPGVDAAEALAEFSRRSGCTPAEVAEARAALLAAPPWVRVYTPDQDGFDYPGQVTTWPHVRDLTALPAPEAEPGQRGDRGALPGLRVAMMVEGIAALARVRMPDGREKLVLQGAGAGTLAGEEPVREFLAAFERSGMVPGHKPGGASWDWLPVAGAYGDPTRGYAGAEVL